MTSDDAGVDAPGQDASTDAGELLDVGSDANSGCSTAPPTITRLTPLSGSGLETLTAVAANPIDGTFVIAGHFDGDAFDTAPPTAVRNAFHLTFRSSSTNVSASALRVYTSSIGNELLDVFVDPHGSVTLGGTLYGGASIVERAPVDTGTSSPSGLVVRLVNGMAPSVAVLAATSGGTVRVNATSRRGDGYLVAGEFRGDLTFGTESCTSSDLDAFIAAFTFEGTLDWLRCFGGPHDQRARGIAIQNAGDIYVVGDFASDITVGGTHSVGARGASDGFVARFSGAGVSVWLQTVGASSPSAMQSLRRVVVSGSRVFAVGAVGDGDTGLAIADLPLGGTDGALVVLDSARGEVLRFARFGDAGDDEVSDIDVDRCGQAWLVGSAANTYGTAFIRTMDTQTLALGSAPVLDPHDVLMPTAVAVSADGASVLVGGAYVGAPAIAGGALPMAQAPSDLFLMTIER